MKNKGILFLFSLFFQKIKYYLFSLFYLSICFIKIKNLKTKNLDELVDFVFNDCRGYLKPMQIRSEIVAFLRFSVRQLADKPKIIMEIGTARGGTLFLFSRIFPKNSFIISLDLPGGEFGAGYPWWEIPLYKSFSKDKQIHLIRVDSHKIKTLEKVKNILGDRKIDLLFIDGDHTYRGVKKDFQFYNPLVRKGGIIAFHDIVQHPLGSKCQMVRFWSEIKKRYDYKEFVEDWQQNWAGIGVIKK